MTFHGFRNFVFHSVINKRAKIRAKQIKIWIVYVSWISYVFLLHICACACVYIYISLYIIKFCWFFKNVFFVHFSYVQVLLLTLKELRNCILCIIRVYKSLHFLPILSVFSSICVFLCFLSVLRFECHVISKYLKIFD